MGTGTAEEVQAQVPYAHSANEQGVRHALVDHLREVARLARHLAEPFGGGDFAYLAGLWHDVGKADPVWQRRLVECEQGTRKRIGIDHKCAGALLAERAGCSMVGLLIQAHHGGLRSPQDYRAWLAEKRELPGPAAALDSLCSVMPDVTDVSDPSYPACADERLGADLFLRMTYSALIDADSLDTETHKLGASSTSRGSTATLRDLWQRYEQFLEGESRPGDSQVNRVRSEVYDSCIEAAVKQPGIFRLTVPTGGGKTRSSMAFALRHGIEHGLRRVIVAVPFTTITQQTAAVYREIFRDQRVVLEHHSAAADGTGTAADDDDDFSGDAVWHRLAAENWDAPIIVTTTVQLFESLFSNRRSKTRKLHSLAQSVIILDEVQALPAGLLSPILTALRQLCADYRTSVVLSTATQPAFDVIREFRDVEAHEIVGDHRRHFEMLRRVEYEWRTSEPCEWPEVARWVRDEHNALVVVNTKRHAMELLDELADPDVLHLSTLLCGAHRGAVLSEIRERLANGSPCRVVSTQVVEAGVDLDFDTVFRAEGPLDAIIQAAGRCNREGRLGRAGRVVVFRSYDDASPPGVYRSGRDIARIVRELPDFDPNTSQTVREYSQWLFGTAVDSDQHGVQELRRVLDFRAVAARFRMIHEDTCDVIVDYPRREVERIDGLVEELRSPRRAVREILRELQPHTVSLPRHEYERLGREGFVEEVAPVRGVGRWQGSYDEVRGIVAVDADLIV